MMMHVVHVLSHSVTDTQTALLQAFSELRALIDTKEKVSLVMQHLYTLDFHVISLNIGSDIGS